MRSSARKFAYLAAAAALTLSLGACAADGSATAGGSESANSADTGAWPRTLTDDAGNEVQIPAKPERVLSTTVSTTGTLLALDAPVVGSSTAAISPQSDENGWFTQWADVAVEREVAPVYQLGNFDLEAVVAQDPDLIVVSTSGADSEMDNLAQLQDLAPTYVVNYGDKDWKSLAEELAEATGTEANAESIISEFDQRAAKIKEKLAIPAGSTASIVSYNKGADSPVGKQSGPHSALIGAMGFEIVEPPAQFDTSAQKREDFAFTSYEGLSESATGESVFLISANDKTAKSFAADPTLSNLPSVTSGNIFPLANSFRLDYYSSNDILDYFENEFPGLNAGK